MAAVKRPTAKQRTMGLPFASEVYAATNEKAESAGLQYSYHLPPVRGFTEEGIKPIDDYGPAQALCGYQGNKTVKTVKTSLETVTCTRCQRLAQENPQIVAWLKAQAREPAEFVEEGQVA